MLTPRQRAVAAARELKLREEARKPLIDESYPQQAKFVKDPSRFVCARTTRRAGKSTGLVYKHLNKGKQHPNCLMPFIGLTRESAKNIIFPAFGEVSRKHNLGLEFKESDLTIRVPGNSTVQLYGADMRNFIDRLRGIKTPCASIDEGQSYRSHLEQLVDDILTPATADFGDGQINLTGTPGPVPKGYFYECSLGKHGFSPHFWTVYDNPYFPKPKEFVADLFAKKGWNENNPTYRREWLGEWVADTDALVYKFSDHNWTYDIPEADDYIYVIGVDLGYSPDPSAFVVAAFNPHDRHVYFIETHTQLEMSVGDVADRIKYYLTEYPNAQVVMDLGAQGKMIGAEIESRYQVPVIAADKAGKAGFIEIFNSELLASKIKLLKGVCEPLVEEWMNLIWDSEKVQRVEDSRYENHLSDAALYTLRFCYNYAYTNRPVPIERGSEREMDAYWEREAERLEQELRAQKEAEKDDWGLVG